MLNSKILISREDGKEYIPDSIKVALKLDGYKYYLVHCHRACTSLPRYVLVDDDGKSYTTACENQSHLFYHTKNNSWEIYAEIEEQQMKRTIVDSSMIRSIGFELPKTLEVEFKNGDVWQYENVSETSYHSLMKADSIGSYFDQRIKQVKAGRKMEPVEPTERSFIASRYILKNINHLTEAELAKIIDFT